MRSKATIFIIQENISLNSTVVKAVRKAVDCQVLVYADVSEIIQAIQHTTPSLLIIDLDFEAKEIKEQIYNLIDFNLPSIVLSSDNRKEFAISLLKKGAVDYIYKKDPKFYEKLTQSVKDVYIVIGLRLKLLSEKRKKIRNLKNAGLLFVAVCLVIISVLGFLE
ncbi:MAG: hypothetical protein R3279_01840 [Putridiphycobacter sp.]|nr:hypothetical protein [Putridiphycobacter sp.]